MMLLRAAAIVYLSGFACGVRPVDRASSLAEKNTAVVFRSDGNLFKVFNPDTEAGAALKKRGAALEQQNATLDSTVARKDGKEDKGVTDFIGMQKSAGVACHSRLLQAKLFLDKLLKDKQDIGKLLREQVLRKIAEEDQLKKAQASIALIKENHRLAREACDAQYEEQMGDVQRYDAELRELNEIANPTVTHHDFSHDEEVARHTGGNLLQENASEVASLLQEKENSNATVVLDLATVENVNFTTQACKVFVEIVHRNHLEHLLGIKEGDADPEKCKKDREQIKVVFVETYINVTERRMATLHEVTRTREECYAAAKDAMEEALQGPVEQERIAQEQVNEATAKIDELTPIYLRIQSREQKMIKYIDEDLKPECEKELDASDTMRAIRHLIHALAKCPSSEDLKLEVPEVVMDPVMVVDLKWHNKNDLDLAVDGPLGMIKHDPTKVAGEGFLDHDDNFEGSPHFKAITSEPREAIFLTKAPDGHYEVGVRLFTMREPGAAPTKFECELKSKLFLKKLCVYAAKECETDVQLSDEVGERKAFVGTIEGEGSTYYKLMSFDIQDNGASPTEEELLDEAEKPTEGSGN